MERRLLYSVKHPNIVRLFHTWQDDQSLYFLLEFAEEGEFWERLMDSNEAYDPVNVEIYAPDAKKCMIGCSLQDARMVLYQTVLGLQHLHRVGFVHRDMKPENIMLTNYAYCADGNDQEKLPSTRTILVDFGTAKDLVACNLNGPEFVGTAQYMSPEVINSQGIGATPRRRRGRRDRKTDEDDKSEKPKESYDEVRQRAWQNGATPASDLWAVGVMLYQMLVGMTPFEEASDYLTMETIRLYAKLRHLEDPVWTKYLHFPPWIDEDARDLVTKLLEPDPSKRLELFNEPGRNYQGDGHHKIFDRIQSRIEDSNYPSPLMRPELKINYQPLLEHQFFQKLPLKYRKWCSDDVHPYSSDMSEDVNFSHRVNDGMSELATNILAVLKEKQGSTSVKGSLATFERMEEQYSAIKELIHSYPEEDTRNPEWRKRLLHEILLRRGLWRTSILAVLLPVETLRKIEGDEDLAQKLRPLEFAYAVRVGPYLQWKAPRERVPTSHVAIEDPHNFSHSFSMCFLNCCELASIQRPGEVIRRVFENLNSWSKGPRFCLTILFLPQTIVDQPANLSCVLDSLEGFRGGGNDRGNTPIRDVVVSSLSSIESSLCQGYFYTTNFAMWKGGVRIIFCDPGTAECLDNAEGMDTTLSWVHSQLTSATFGAQHTVLILTRAPEHIVGAGDERVLHKLRDLLVHASNSQSNVRCVLAPTIADPEEATSYSSLRALLTELDSYNTADGTSLLEPSSSLRCEICQRENTGATNNFEGSKENSGSNSESDSNAGDNNHTPDESILEEIRFVRVPPLLHHSIHSVCTLSVEEYGCHSHFDCKVNLSDLHDGA